MSETSFLYEVTAEDGCVAAWSVTRLPFEPKGWLHDFREDLRAALRSMPLRPGDHLTATYTTPATTGTTEFADVENVLFYNVGSGSYSHLLAGGVECHRVQGTDALHRVTYLTGSTWGPHESIEQFASFQAPLTGPLKNPTDWWWLLRRNVTTTAAPPSGAEYWIDLTLSGSWTGTRLAGALKPMLDGLVSALHSHDGTSRDELEPRLRALGADDSVWATLTDPEHAVLGTRRLVRPHRAGVAWNPADDLCAGFQVRQFDGPPQITATVHTVAPPIS